MRNLSLPCKSLLFFSPFLRLVGKTSGSFRNEHQLFRFGSVDLNTGKNLSELPTECSAVGTIVPSKSFFGHLSVLVDGLFKVWIVWACPMHTMAKSLGCSRESLVPFSCGWEWLRAGNTA